MADCGVIVGLVPTDAAAQVLGCRSRHVERLLELGELRGRRCGGLVWVQLADVVAMARRRARRERRWRWRRYGEAVPRGSGGQPVPSPQ